MPTAPPQPAPQLKADQIDQFNQDGFVVLRGFIGSQWLAQLRRGYDNAVANRYDVDGWKQKIKPGAILQLGMPHSHIPEWNGHPYLAHIIAAGKQLLGDDIEYKYDQLIYKPPHNPVELLWHQDAGYGWPGKANFRGLTCWLALSDVSADMGSLQFIPGSHLDGIAEHVDATYKNPINGALEVDVAQERAVTVEYAAGDVSFHHGRTLHYSPGNSTDRPRRGLSTHLWPAPNA